MSQALHPNLYFLIIVFKWLNVVKVLTLAHQNPCVGTQILWNTAFNMFGLSSVDNNCCPQKIVV